MESGACFDATGAYRYSLWRKWNYKAPRLAFVMLNPSTADAQMNDPTIRRCLRFAQTWGYGSMEIVNLFALRTSQPTILRKARDPIGPDCDHHILTAVEQADRVILAWGNWGNLYGRDRTVLDLLTARITARKSLYCFGLTQAGQPRHPLYLRQDVQLIPYQAEAPSLESEHSPDQALHHGGSAPPAGNIL